MKLKTLFACLLLNLVAVSATAQKIEACYDQAADFSKVQTYSWSRGAPAKNSELDRRIIDSIDRHLKARGLRRVDDNPDLIVSYHVALLPDFEHATVARPGTWGPRTGSMEQAWLVTRGSLIVAIVDRKLKQHLWRAHATDTVQDERVDVNKELDKVTKKVEKAIEKMFKLYPANPKEGKKS
jgi:hypothetical protein